MVPAGPLHAGSPAELRARIHAERVGAPFLLYRGRHGEQRIVTLADVSSLSVGRDAANDITLEWDTEVSRLHAELARMGAEWTIADEGLSRNGTYVNGKRVSGRRRLRDGDVIAFGTTQVVFRSPASARLEETGLPAATRGAPALSPAQQRVLTALCRPFATAEHASPASNQQIADELCVTVDAVKANLRALFDKFEVEDLPQNRKRARLVELAFQSGLVTSRDL